jgi:hypothetical protein
MSISINPIRCHSIPPQDYIIPRCLHILLGNNAKTYVVVVVGVVQYLIATKNVMELTFHSNGTRKYVLMATK